MQFIRDYDGVHILLKDRSEIGNFTLPNSRNRENLDV